MASPQQSSIRAPSLYLLLSLIGGFCLARSAAAPTELTGPLLGAAVLLCLLAWTTARERPALWLICFLSAATLGAWTYASWRLPQKPDSAAINLPIREASLHFEVEQVMQARTAYGNASGLGRVVAADSPSRLRRGDRIYFRITLPEDRSFELLRGSEIRAVGLIDAIEPGVEARSFEAYLLDTGVYHRFTRTRALEQVAPPSRFEYFCQSMNERFESFLRLGAPDHGGYERIYVAMLLGKKAELTAEQSERFRLSGTMHFFAISGLHIGVIATVIAQALLLLRVPSKVAPFIGLPLLYLYVEITGAPPSAVRAFLMALFFWLSFALSRQRSPLAALLASAIFVLIVAPGQLWSLGFQLSYTVVLSILLFGLPLYERATAYLTPFSYLPKDDWALWQRVYARALEATLLVCSVSFSAWLASAPLSAAFFGYFSPAAILLNVVLVNLVALAIIAGVLSLVLALLGAGFAAAFINHAAWLSIGLMDGLVSGSIHVPFNVIHTTPFDKAVAYGTLIVYFAALIITQERKSRRNRDWVTWLLPPAIIMMGILIGLS